jgi:hypothetical protein
MNDRFTDMGFSQGHQSWGALRNFTHFGGHLKNGCQNDCHFEIALVTFL